MSDRMASHENEMMVLGSMLHDIVACSTACDLLTAEDFHNKKNRIIFEIIKDNTADKVLDSHLIAEFIQKRNALKEFGTFAEAANYIVHLNQLISNTFLIDEYIRIVKEKSLTRSLSAAVHNAGKLLAMSQEEPAEILEQLQNTLLELSKTSKIKEGKLLKEIINAEEGFMAELNKRMDAFYTDPGQSQINGIRTYFRDLDQKITGLRNGELIILGARPSMGKTSFALNIADNVASHGFRVGVFSLETREQIFFEKLLSSRTNIIASQIEKGQIAPGELERIRNAVKELENTPIIILSETSVNVSQIRSIAKRWKEKHDIRLLIIDYLQLIMPKSRKNVREQEVSEISRTLKTIAMELNIPVLCLAQLNRDVENRQNKIPQLTDLRESGAIEQDCDVAMFIHRRDYYDPNDKPGEAEIVVAKNRNGETGEVKMQFIKPFTRFENYEKIESPYRMKYEAPD